MTESRVRPVARAVLPLGALGCLLWWAAGPPGQSLPELGGLLREAPQFDPLLTETAGAIAWLCLCWFGLVSTLQLFALGSNGLARACQWTVRLVAPRFMLAGARWLIGVSLLAGPLTSGVATAAQVGGASAPPSPAAVVNLDRPALPDLDRPVAPTFAAASTPAAAVSAPAQPALAPSGPSKPSLRAVPSPARSAPLVTGRPHRETADTVGAYVVRRGDTLWDIAARHLGAHASAADVARAWPRWYAANQAAIGPNPQLIHPGLVLHAPPE